MHPVGTLAVQIVPVIGVMFSLHIYGLCVCLYCLLHIGRPLALCMFQTGLDSYTQQQPQQGDSYC